MKVNFNPNDRNGYKLPFQMKLVETKSLNRYIDGFHFEKNQKNLRQALTLIKNKLAQNPEDKYLKIYALHPSNANYVKNGTYDEYFYDGKKLVKQTRDKYERENIYMQLDGSNKTQNFYMNPNEKPENLARWFMDTFNFYRKNL